ncbi:MAG: protein kinase [Myxococcota bacterium]|nr:protein kinase [Myxococcota bacterium]
MSIALDDYLIDRKLGAGGLADVFAATSPDGKVVALKLLREPDRGGGHVRRFLREGRLLQRFSHPALPKCFDIVEGDRPYIVLELMEGETLSERVRGSGPLASDQVIRVATEVMGALQYLHSHGVVHRDVKSANIFLKNDGKVMLMDLGLAVDPVDPFNTTLGDVMGTYAYMAPEQIAGAEMDRRADLYSLGVSCFEALVGKRPFGAIGAAAMLQAQRQEGATTVTDSVPEDTPGRLVEFLTRLMAWDPTARPASAGVALAILTGRAGFQRELEEPPLVGRNAAIGAIEAVLDSGVRLQLVSEDGMGVGRVLRVAWNSANARKMEVVSLRCRRRASGLLALDQLRDQLEACVGKLDSGVVNLAKALNDLHAESGVLLIIEDIDHASIENRLAIEELLNDTQLPVLLSSNVPLEFPGRELILRPLRVNEVRQMISGMLSGGEPPPGMAEELFRLTGGVPAAISAAVKDLHSRGLLIFDGLDDEGEVRWTLTGDLASRPGAVLRDFAEGILEKLPEDERNLLDVLGVAGEPVPLFLALAASELDTASLVPNRLVQRGLVIEKQRPDGLWLELKRPAMATLVVSNMSRENQRYVHARFASCMEQEEPSRWRDERLAIHQALGSPENEAPRALVGLGTWLAKSGDYVRCLDVLERASHHLHLDPLTATYGALARGTSLLGLARFSEAADAFLACRRLSEEQNRDDLVAQSMLELSEACRQFGNVTRSQQAAQDALRFLGSRAEVNARARAEVLQAFVHLNLGELAEAEGLFLSLSAAEDLPVDLAARIQLGLLLVQSELGHIDQAAIELEDLLKDLEDEEVGIRTEVAYYLGRAQLEAGQTARAQETIWMLDRFIRESGVARARVLGTVLQAALDTDCGDLHAAGGGLRRLRGLEYAPTVARMDFWRVRGDVRLFRGDHPAALAAHQRGAEEAERCGWKARRAYHEAMRAVLTGAGEELGEALGWLHAEGHRQLSARILLAGARVGADPEVMAAAVGAAQESGNRFLHLRALHLAGSSEAAASAELLSRQLHDWMRADKRSHFAQTPHVKWLGSRLFSST